MAAQRDQYRFFSTRPWQGSQPLSLPASYHEHLPMSDTANLHDICLSVITPKKRTLSAIAMGHAHD